MTVTSEPGHTIAGEHRGEHYGKVLARLSRNAAVRRYLEIGVAFGDIARTRLGWAMAIFGVGVLARAVWAFWHGEPPQADTMGLVGALALAANVGVAVMLYAFREGDANMRAVWLCSRNDALGNVAVVAAAGGVALTGQAWPDLLVAIGMAGLALHSSRQVLRQASDELRRGSTAAS